MVTTLALALGLFIAGPAPAASPTGTLQAFFASANTILQSVDPARSLDEPRQAIRGLVNEVFDYEEAAELVLGPVWPSKTPAEQAEFVRLFADFLERGFVAMIGSKASVAGGLKVRYLGEIVDGQSATVSTALVTRSGSDVPVAYSMVRLNDRWMARDVVIEGVSLIANYRAQFARVIRTSSYDALIVKMRGDAAELPPARRVVAAAKPLPTVPSPPTPVPGATPVATPAAVIPPVAAPPVVLPVIAQVAVPPPAVAPPPPAPSPVVAPPPARMSAIAATSYWVQVGAFKTVNAAVRVAEQLRRLGIAASNGPLPSPPGQPAAALTRVRIGPFASRADAQSKLHELVARGYTPFIAEANN